MRIRRPSRLFSAAISYALFLSVCLSGCTTPSWVTQLEQNLPAILNATTSVISILASTGLLATSPQVAAIEEQAVKGLQLLCGNQMGQGCTPQSLVGVYQAAATRGNLQALVAELQAVQAELQQLLAIARVVNAKTQATIAAALALILAMLGPLVQSAPAAAAALAAGAAPPAIALPLSPSAFRSQFNDILARGGFSQYALR